MPGAGHRGQDAMDAWLERDQLRILPQDSPTAELIKNVTPNLQVKRVIASGASMNVKYKETARGGLAVNIIEC
ncbi:hypothetical protein [Streptomyces sp. NBC_00996]|uniref:hypothetical protein n=1 Tax=Streptomyces sp. NBC_00996 TaxID=2903710 RepID=UPI00386448F5|nr:hypothetical protein OG390_35740 [Streptomyces sp. NBC_00996]